MQKHCFSLIVILFKFCTPFNQLFMCFGDLITCDSSLKNDLDTTNELTEMGP